jgi:hypothetical protein
MEEADGESVILAPGTLEPLILNIQKKYFWKLKKFEEFFLCKQWCILSSLQSLNSKYSVF